MAVLAAVDIGANSVRLKVVRLHNRRISLLHEDREVLRLGAEVFRHHRLGPDAMARTVKVIRRFHKAVRRLNADAVRVVATSPLREAQNAAELAAWVEAATGWRVEVISGLEEGRLIHQGVLAGHRFRAERLLLVDLGGGSCELALSEQGHIQHLVSLPLGAVRLTDTFLVHDPPRPTELARLRQTLRGELGRTVGLVRRARPQLMVATSGTAAALAGAAGSGVGRRRVSRAAVTRLADNLAHETLAERARRPGIGPRRAEIIVAGAALFAELLESGGLSGFAYSPLGLREGVLAQMAADRAAGSSLIQRLQEDREHALLAAARHYSVDLAHARRVRRWCGLLFTQLRAIHRLPLTHRGPLDAAALLHEAGAYINRAGQRRHSEYLIAHTEILGFSQQHRNLAAMLARYIGNQRPLPGEHALRPLGVEASLLLPRAAVMLRLACALEQSRRGAVRCICVRRRPGVVHLELRPGPGGAALELWALERERNYFRAVFGLDLSCALA